MRAGQVQRHPVTAGPQPRLVVAAGTRVWALGSDGKVRRVAGLAEDITDQHTAQEKSARLAALTRENPNRAFVPLGQIHLPGLQFQMRRLWGTGATFLEALARLGRSSRRGAGAW